LCSGTHAADEVYDIHFSPSDDAVAGYADDTEFWKNLIDTVAGCDVNVGLDAERMRIGLDRLRSRAVIIYITTNVIWIAALCAIYEVLLDTYRSVNVFGLFMTVMYGYPLVVQLVGMTVYRLRGLVDKLARRITPQTR
jgi:hypothetical protein